MSRQLKMIAVVLFVLTVSDYVGVLTLRDAVLGIPEEILMWAVLVGLPLSFLLAIIAASLEGELCQLGRVGWGWVAVNAALLLSLNIPEVDGFIWDLAPHAPWLVWALAVSAFAVVAFAGVRR